MPALQTPAVLAKTQNDATYAPVAQAVPVGGNVTQVLTRIGASFGWADPPAGSSSSSAVVGQAVVGQAVLGNSSTGGGTSTATVESALVGSAILPS